MGSVGNYLRHSIKIIVDVLITALETPGDVVQRHRLNMKVLFDILTVAILQPDPNVCLSCVLCMIFYISNKVKTMQIHSKIDKCFKIVQVKIIYYNVDQTFHSCQSVMSVAVLLCILINPELKKEAYNIVDHL